VKVSEINFEKGVIEAPEFNFVRHIQNGVIKVPELDFTWKLDKGSSTLPYLRSWYFNNEVHDMLIVDTDAMGQPFQQFICQACEMTKLLEPEYDAGNVSYAKNDCHIVPYAITAVDPA
jgi:hypothetical protein